MAGSGGTGDGEGDSAGDGAGLGVGVGLEERGIITGLGMLITGRTGRRGRL